MAEPVKSKICPETGINLEGRDVVKHAISVWGVEPHELNRLKNDEAVRRYKAVLAMK